MSLGIEKETYIKRGDFLKFGILTMCVRACVCVGVCVGVGIEKETYIKRGDFLKFGILTWLVGACVCAQYLPNIYKFNLLNKSAITILNIKKNYVHNIYTTYFVIMSLIKLLLFMHTDIHLFVLNNSNPYQSPLLEKKNVFYIGLAHSIMVLKSFLKPPSWKVNTFHDDFSTVLVCLCLCQFF